MSSAPFTPLKHIKGEPLTIKLGKGHGVKAIGWKGQSLFSISDNIKTFELKREALGKLPENLILFPRDPKNRPRVIVIKKDQKIFKDIPRWERVKSNEVFLWGVTPLDVCHFTSKSQKSLSSFSFILFPRPKVLGATGSFFLKLEKKEYPQYFHGFTNHGKVGQFEAPPLKRPTEKQMKRCSRYHGGPCDFLFQIPEDAYGSSIHLPLPAIQKSSVPCPV